jgi:predicted DNA-binding transcriptional regulator YafY
MVRKAERLFQVVNLIRVYQPITAKKLSEHIGVSIRTIYRYIDDLSLGGIPIYGEAGIGYSMEENFELPPLNLTSTELEALTLSIDLLTQSVGDDLSVAARSLLAKINAVLPSAIQGKNEARILSLTKYYSLEHMLYWDRLRRAILEYQAVHISYLSLSQELSEREIFPLGLFYWGGKWTVGAWCTLRHGYRDFRVDRIQTLSKSSDLHQLPSHISFTAYMQFKSND